MRHRQSYAGRIDRAIAHLQARLAANQVPTVAELAAAAALSEFHFHRVFRVMTGETIGEAIIRLRLASSLPSLQGKGISAATGQSGYASAQAYSKALRSAAGTSPGELRREGSLLEHVAATLSVPAQITDQAALAIQAVSLEPLRLLAVRNVGAYQELNVGFERLFELVMAQLEPAPIRGIWGIAHDDPRETPAAACRFDCALDTGGEGAAQGDLVLLEPGAGRFLSLALTGDFDLLHERADLLYAYAIDHGHELGADDLLIAYLDDADEVPPEQQRAIVYLPLCHEED